MQKPVCSIDRPCPALTEVRAGVCPLSPTPSLPHVSTAGLSCGLCIELANKNYFFFFLAIFASSPEIIASGKHSKVACETS